MVTEEEYFERGLKNLSENPPNLIKALSLLRKAKDIFEEKGMVKKINSCKDKIEYIYKTLARNEYEKANMFLKKSEYKNSIMKSLESYKFILKSEPNDIDKALKKVKSLIEEAIIQLLYDIERRSMKKGYSEDAINELSFAEKTILSVFFPNLKENTENGVIPEKFINKIGERKKLQRSLINSYEMLGNKARSKGAKLLNDGNINKGHEMINIARDLYEKSDFFEKIKSLLPLYYQVYEALGDAEYTLGQKMVEKGRLERGRRHIKKARDYFKEAKSNKKIDLAKKSYLKISLTIGENILNDANNALKIGDLTSAVSFFDTAFNFFKGLNHKKNMSKADRKRKEIYKELADKEFQIAGSSINNELKLIDKTKTDKSEEWNLSPEISANIDLINNKLQHLHDAQFYYKKADIEVLARKAEKNIIKYSEELAKIFQDQAKEDVSSHKFESAYINYNKSLFYYESIKKERKIKVLKEYIEKVHNKLDRKKLERLQRLIAEKEIIDTEQSYSKIGVDGNLSMKSLPSDISDETFRCKSCGKWVSSNFFDSFQQKCINCRKKIYCDECSKELGANTIYMQCIDCSAKFCEECMDRVYDFTQKKCASCREVLECNICNDKAGLNHELHYCSSCNKNYCDIHWDIKQNLCVNCKKYIKCTICNKEIIGSEVFVCNECSQTFCAIHFDEGRRVCLEDRKEEICAKCGTLIKENELSFKCVDCGFMYCFDHYSRLHQRCKICLNSSSPSGELKCFECSKILYNENFYTCPICKNVFCGDHYDLIKNRCKNCLDKLIEQPVPISTSNNVHISNQQTTQLDSEKENALIFNTLKEKVEKYNKREILEPEEISFLNNHQINLSKEESKYINIGNVDESMIILFDEEIPYVALVPEIPITENSKYFGDLIRKLIKYIPNITDTLDNTIDIINLLYFALHNANWNQMYNMLYQTLLKPGLTVINAMKVIFEKESDSVITKSLVDSPFKSIFSGIEGIEIKDIIKFIKTNESEEEVGIFSDNERLDQLMRVFYNLYLGNIPRASELLAILEL